VVLKSPALSNGDLAERGRREDAYQANIKLLTDGLAVIC
jgi:hypothetical protein